MFIVIIIFIIFNLIFCGLPYDEVVSILNSPDTLVAKRNGNEIDISFYAKNLESTFKGYNIYMHYNSPNKIKIAHAQNIYKKTLSSLDTLRDVFILKAHDSAGNPTLNPTIPRFYSFDVTKKRSKVEYTITSLPNLSNITSISWFIAVTAVSENLESDLSNIVQLQ